MRILQVIHGFLPQFRGGTELYLRGLSRELRERGQTVQVFAGTTHSSDVARTESYEFDGMEVTQLVLAGPYLEHWSRSYSPTAERLFAEELRRARPDVVHIHHWFRLSRNLLETCYRLGIPAVCTLHDLYATCPSFFRVIEGSFTEAPLDDDLWVDALPRLPWMNDAEVREEIDLFAADFKNELGLAHRIIVPSRAHGDLVTRLLDLSEDRLVVLPHGTITSDAAPAKPETAKSGEKIRLGYWGHLFHMKGPHLLMEALRASEVADRFELHVWGKVVEPHYERRLREASKGLDVTWYGAFTPEDVEKVALDCAVLPSSCSESYSFVLDEAFRLGLPAIVSDRGALGERVGDAGARFEPESSESLRAVLEDLARDPKRLERWRAAIPSLVSMKEHAGAVLDLYADVVRRRDMSRLQPDFALIRRRTETLSRRVLEREEAMFAYLGRINREKGRGDHYTKVVEEMIQKEKAMGARVDEADQLIRAHAERGRIIEVLAREIIDLRETLRAFGEGEARPLPEMPRIAEHVPGLGAAAAIIQENQSTIETFRARLSGDSEVGRREATIKFLIQEIVTLRRGIDAAIGGQDLPDLDPAELPAVEINLPELGTALQTSQENSERLRALYAECEMRWEQERKRLLVLAHDIEAFANALELAPRPEFDASILPVAAAEREELRSTPGWERLQEYVGRSPERLRAFAEAWRARSENGRGLEERVAENDREASQRRDMRSHYETTLDELRRDRDEGLRQLGVIVEDLRRALTLIHSEDPSFEASPSEGGAESINVPGLGDLETIRKVNQDLIEQFLNRLKE